MDQPEIDLLERSYHREVVTQTREDISSFLLKAQLTQSPAAYLPPT